MTDYKPLTDEELDHVERTLLYPGDDSTAELQLGALEQARHANALAFSLLSGNPYHLSDEQRVLLHAYLGETND